MWMYLLKLTPPIENRTVTQAVRQIVATASHNSGLLSKNGLPSIIPTRLKIHSSLCYCNFFTGYSFFFNNCFFLLPPAYVVRRAVMFLQASVCPHRGLGVPYLHSIILPLVPCPFWGVPHLHPIILPLVLCSF